MKRASPLRKRNALALSIVFAWAITSGLAAQTAAPAPAPAPAASENSIYDEDPSATVAPRIPDKVEGLNRALFKFNDRFYHYALRPLAHGYAKIFPQPIRAHVGIFFHNLGFPTRFVGNVLEGHFTYAGTEAERFVINTVSSLGFVATADSFKSLPERPSDLGQAFGSWGIGHGTYLVLPILGPSSLRDGIGLGLSDYFLDPIQYIPKWKIRLGVGVYQVVNESPELMDDYDTLIAGSIDPYVALRDAYSSRRSHRPVRGTESPVTPAATAIVPRP